MNSKHEWFECDNGNRTNWIRGYYYVQVRFSTIKDELETLMTQIEN